MLERCVKTTMDKEEDSKCSVNDAEFFSSIEVSGIFELVDGMPDIDQVLSIITDPELVSLETINTAKAISAEGQRLTGKKVAVEIRMRQKILYVANGHGQAVHIIEDERFEGAYVVVPALIEGTVPEILIKNKRLKAKVEVEDAIIKKVGSRSVFTDVHLFLKLDMIPTYELCYSLYSDDSNSGLFICHGDGTNSTPVISGGCKNVNPSWSPAGQEIAFLSNREGTYMLYVLNTKDLASRRVTDPSVFR